MDFKYFFIVMCFVPGIFTGNIQAQSHLEIQNCKDIIVYYDDHSVPEGSIQELSYILEKELIANVWEKIEVVNSLENIKTFKELPTGSYRVSVIPTNTKRKRITKIFKNKMKSQKTDKAKYDVFVSNTVEITGMEDCDELSGKQDDFSHSTTIKIFPNPVNKVLNIFSPEEKDGHVSIFNVLRQSVKDQQLDKEGITELDLSNFNTGVYIVCIYSSGQLIHSEKISCLGR